MVDQDTLTPKNPQAHLGVIFIHEAVETGYIKPAKKVIDKAGILSSALKIASPAFSQFLTTEHLTAVFSSYRFALQAGGLNLALAIHRQTFGPGGKNRDQRTILDRTISILALRSESRQNS